MISRFGPVLFVGRWIVDGPLHADSRAVDEAAHLRLLCSLDQVAGCLDVHESEFVPIGMLRPIRGSDMKHAVEGLECVKNLTRVLDLHDPAGDTERLQVFDAARGTDERYDLFAFGYETAAQGLAGEARRACQENSPHESGLPPQNVKDVERGDDDHYATAPS